MGMIMIVGMTSFASLEDNGRLNDFAKEYQETQDVEMISREMPEDLEITDVREFFRTNLNNYDK